MLLFDNGINYFDTADLYDKGLNEINIGNALKAKRDQIIIATKVGNQWRSDGTGWDWNPRKDYILKAVEQSLQRLQTNYIDLYQLHGGHHTSAIVGIRTIEQLTDAVNVINNQELSEVEMKILREAATVNYYAEHR